jgi:predicted permease
MVQLLVLVEVLFIFLLIILLGYSLGKFKLVSDRFADDLNTLMMNVTLPMMLINSFIQPFSQELTEQGLVIALVTIGCLFISFLVGLLFLKILRVERNRQGVWLLISTFSNLGFAGFPIIEAMYGKEGLFLASFVQIPYGPCFFILGALMMTMGQDTNKVTLRKVFASPIMITIAIGLVLYFTQIKPPTFAVKTMSMIGSMTGPIAMLIVGLKLSLFPLAEVFSSAIQYKLAFVRLLAAPIAVLLVFKLFPAASDTLLRSVMIITCALPGPGNATNMAVTYGGDVNFAARCTALTAILSIFTMPIVFFLLSIA